MWLLRCKVSSFANFIRFLWLDRDLLENDRTSSTCTVQYVYNVSSNSSFIWRCWSYPYLNAQSFVLLSVYPHRKLWVCQCPSSWLYGGTVAFPSVFAYLCIPYLYTVSRKSLTRALGPRTKILVGRARIELYCATSASSYSSLRLNDAVRRERDMKEVPVKTVHHNSHYPTAAVAQGAFSLFQSFE